MEVSGRLASERESEKGDILHRTEITMLLVTPALPRTAAIGAELCRQVRRILVALVYVVCFIPGTLAALPFTVVALHVQCTILLIVVVEVTSYVAGQKAKEAVAKSTVKLEVPAIMPLSRVV